MFANLRYGVDRPLRELCTYVYEILRNQAQLYLLRNHSLRLQVNLADQPDRARSKRKETVYFGC